MPTSISGNVRLVYGNHIHSETYSTAASAYSNTNPFNEYASGGARALVAGGAIDVGTLDLSSQHEGLLIIKNTNTVGSLSVSVDGGTAYDISIPAGLVNLISVGPDHPVYVKCPTATNNGLGVASVTSAGVITFDGSAGAVGTATMTGVANVNSNTNKYLVQISTQGTGTVYELDGVTKKNLTSDYGATSTVNLEYFTGYRYTLTEA
tara:strand:+ start:9308 stop:9928 length:621 start_codon:yes stop_codon:yes gene_type:complete